MNTFVRLKRSDLKLNGVRITHLRFIDRISVVEVILITGAIIAYRYTDCPDWLGGYIGK